MTSSFDHQQHHKISTLVRRNMVLWSVTIACVNIESPYIYIYTYIYVHIGVYIGMYTMDKRLFSI